VPFFAVRRIALFSSRRCGVEYPSDRSSAYGQSGGMMIELVVQHNPQASALHDMLRGHLGKGAGNYSTPLPKAARADRNRLQL
jgi:hypothetical protein